MNPSGTAKGLADNAHNALLPGLPTLPASNTMTGAILVCSADLTTTHFKATANYHGSPEDAQQYHVESGLLAELFNWTKNVQKTPWILPAGSVVYMYVYYSPCKLCTENVAPLRMIRSTWIKNNPTVIWNLLFSSYFVGRKNGYTDMSAANSAYSAYLSHFHSITKL